MIISDEDCYFYYEEHVMEDCYFYHEEHMMEGRIPCCSFEKYALGVCPCNKCTNYIPQSEVYKLVKSEMLSGRKEE